MKKLKVIYKPRNPIENDIIEIFLDGEKTIKIYDEDEELSNNLDTLSYIYSSIFSVLTSSFSVRICDFIFSQYGQFSFFGENNILFKINTHNGFVKFDLLLNEYHLLSYFSKIKLINNRFYLQNNVSIPKKTVYDFCFYKILELYCEKNKINIELISI